MINWYLGLHIVWQVVVVSIIGLLILFILWNKVLSFSIKYGFIHDFGIKRLLVYIMIGVFSISMGMFISSFWLGLALYGFFTMFVIVLIDNDMKKERFM